jgi:hypothetical protein
MPSRNDLARVMTWQTRATESLRSPVSRLASSTFFRRARAARRRCATSFRSDSGSPSPTHFRA